MGMYDTLWIKIRCPKCTLLSNIDLQTKSGRRTLHNYHLGDKFLFDAEKLKYEKATVNYHRLKKYLIWLLGSCEKCKCQFSGCAWVNPKTFVIEEVDLHSYTISIDIKKKLRGIKNGRKRKTNQP